ncbi:MAG: tetratricopeptide repeat protein, partial [Deltaproteobacteria bacterium]|nr:tetratricopeptide repeat protein [Deltaproteobacteria bacterium]
MKKNYFFILISLFVFNFLTTNGNTKYIVRPHNQAIIHNNMGAQFMAQQDLDKAIFEFKTAIEISPEYVEAWNNLGLAYKYKKDYNKAVDTFKQAIKI